MISFIGIIKEVKSRTTITNDKVYRIILETDDPQLIETGAWPSMETVLVTLERDRSRGLSGARHD